AELLSCSGINHLNEVAVPPIVAGGDELSAVRAQGESNHAGREGWELTHHLSGTHVEDTNRALAGSRREERLAVGCHDQPGRRLGGDTSQLAPGGWVPGPERSVAPDRMDLCPVRSERRGRDTGWMARQIGKELAGGRVPERDGRGKDAAGTRGER